MNKEKWTIRDVSQEALDKITEVRDATGIPYGRLVTKAIDLWYESLEAEGTLVVNALRQTGEGERK